MSKHAPYKFRLYVTGNAPNSASAIGNLESLCREHLPDRHLIEIVDVLLYPKRALADGVVLTPTLVKLSPPPVRKIIGTLNDRRTLLQALELAVKPS